MIVRKSGWGFVVFFFLLAALACAQSGTDQLSKDEILRRWAAALGGQEKLAAIHVLHVKSKLATGGLKGAYEEWDSERGQHRDVTDIPGAFSQDEIYDGQKGWVRELSGKVHELSGSDLEDQVTSAYQGSFSWLVPGRMPGEVEFMGEDPSHATYVFNLKPKNGKPYSVFLDKQTFLPVREEQRESGKTQVQYFSDWREMKGIKFPAQIRQSTGNAKFDVLFTLEQVEVNPPVEAKLFEMPEETAAKVRFASGKDSTEFPFKRYGVDVMVPVRVNGKGPSWFVFDTGAEVSALVKDRAKELGIKSKGSIEGEGSGGSAEVGLIPDVTLQLPGVEIPTKVIAEFPDPGLSAVAGQAFQGVIGYDVISQFVVRLDYEKKTITLYDPASFHYAGSGTVLPITFRNGNNLNIPGKVELPDRPPIDVLLTIDTGSSGTIDLNAPFVDANHAVQAVGKTIPGSSYGLGGRSSHLVGRLASLEIGPYQMAQPIVELSQDTKGTEANPDRAANVGGQILSRFTIYLDYPHNRLILEPNAHLHDAFEYDMSGLRLISPPPKFERIVVNEVREDCPAAKAGMQRGDVITKIDGVPSSRYTLDQVKKMFRREGTVKLTVERSGKSIGLVLHLRPLI